MKPLYDEELFNCTVESIQQDEYIVATCYYEDSLAGEEFLDHFDIIQKSLIESSTGGFGEVEGLTDETKKRFSGKMLGYYEIPAPPGVKKAIVQFGYPIDESICGSAPELMLPYAGNSLVLSEKARLLDVTFPKNLVDKFAGPKFGISGIREYLGVEKRPIVIHIIKPKIGLTAKEVAEQCYQTALGGVDCIKDDEYTRDVYNCKLEERVEAVAEALAKAEKKTGKKVIYFASITDEVDRIKDRAKRAIKAGATGLLVAYTIGPSGLRILADDPEINVPIFMHPVHMVHLREKISWVPLCKTLRLCGADMIITGTYWGSIRAGLEEGIRTAQVLQAPLYNIKRTWSLFGGRCHPGLTELSVQELGLDVGFPVGTCLLSHPQGATAGAKAWIQALEAVTNNVALAEAAKSKPELKVALEKWGLCKRPVTLWPADAKYRNVKINVQRGETDG